MYVCLSDDNFQKPWHRKFIFAYTVNLHGIRVKFIYEGHQVKLTAAKKRTQMPVHALINFHQPFSSVLTRWCREWSGLGLAGMLV